MATKHWYLAALRILCIGLIIAAVNIAIAALLV